MTGMTDGAVTGASIDSVASFRVTGNVTAAVVVGVGLAWAARTGPVELLVAVAVVQALLAFAWVLGARMPGRVGALVIAALASAAADTAVSVWPHSRLGTLLPVLGLAIPAMFVHQLWRGAARVRVVESLGGIALLVVAVVSLPALLQLRHEFGAGADVVFGVVVVGAGALVVGYVVDLIHAAPRFDADVPRGPLAVIAAAAIGAVLGQLTLCGPLAGALRSTSDFANGRALVVGAALGAVIAVLAVANAFVEHGGPLVESVLGRRVRPAIAVTFPMSVLAPVAYLLCLTVRA